MPFPAAYYGSPQQLTDVEFLLEIQHLGLRVPAWISSVVWDAYEASNDESERRAYAARIVGEMAQVAELFCLLVLSVRRRATDPILATFVDHQTHDLVAVMQEFAQGPHVPIGQLLHAPEPEHTPQTAELFAAVAAAGQQLAAVFAAADGAVWKFYNKTKHGFPIVRSLNLGGPPFFGENPDLGVWALYRLPQAEGGGLAAVGFRATPQLTALLRDTTGRLTTAAHHLAGLIRGGIEQHTL